MIAILQNFIVKQVGMLSTINDDEAIKTVLSISLPKSTIDYLIKINGFRRLAFLVEGGEPVG